MTTAVLSGKIEMLPPHRQQEVSDFVDFLLASANAKKNFSAADAADDTLKTKNKKEKDIVYELAGSWKDDRTVEEMIADIRSSRISNTRLLENLDD